MSEAAAAPAAETTETPAIEQPATDTPAPAEQVEQTDAEKEAAAKVYTQDEVDKLVKKNARNERYRAKKETEARIYSELAHAGRQNLNSQPHEKSPQTVDKPSRAQYADDSSYLEALTEWKVGVEVAGRLAEERNKTAAIEDRKRSAKALESLQERTERFVQDAADDFYEVVGDSEAPMSTAMQEALLESEMAPQIIYHLAKNPAEAERIAGLSAASAAREIGRLEAKLSAPTAAKPRTTSAPTPPSLSQGRGQGRPDPGSMSMEQYAAYRRARAKA